MLTMRDIMNEWGIYIALYYVLLYTQSALQSYKVSLLNHHQCAASNWMMRRQPQHNGASALTTHQLQVGRRERESQSSGWGLLGGHDWQGPVEGIWPGHWGYTPTLYNECHGIFNDHKESGPQFNVSPERRCSFDSIVSPSLYWGIRTHTDCRVSTPCWPP